MGQRHQVYVIARIRPHPSQDRQPRYRCIAALHHQWCYGTLPLTAAHRVLTLVKQPENAEVIREELRYMDGRFADDDNSTSKLSIPAAPSPFISFLLAASWNVDLEDPKQPYTSGGDYHNNLLDVKQDPYHMGTTPHFGFPVIFLGSYRHDQTMLTNLLDNNDGITVIDITNPESPAYCLVSISGLEGCSPAPTLVPLSGAQYGRAYYPEPKPGEPLSERARFIEDDIQRAIVSLSGESLVTRSMLEEAWPYVFQEDDEEPEVDESTDEEGENGSLNEDKRNNEKVDPEPVHDTDFKDAHGNISTLVDMSLKAAVTWAVETGDTQAIEELLWMPGKASLVKSILLDWRPLPPNGISLLKKAITSNVSSVTTIDLSACDFTSEQLVDIIAICKNIESLNLSYNPNVTTSTIERILDIACPSLRRLVIMNCISLDDEELADLMRNKPGLFKYLDALVCPICIDYFDRAKLPNTFTFLSSYTHYTSRSQPLMRGCTMSVATPTRIIQCLTDFFAPIVESNAPQYFMGEPGMVFAAFTAPRKPEDKWSARSVVQIPQTSRMPFVGEGWLFLLKSDLYGYTNSPKHQWGFIRWVRPSTDPAQEVEAVVADASAGEHGHANAESSTASVESQGAPAKTAQAKPAPDWTPEVHDLWSFLQVMRDEGRPEVHDDLVIHFETLLESLKQKAGAVMLDPTDL